MSDVRPPVAANPWLPPERGRALSCWDRTQQESLRESFDRLRDDWEAAWLGQRPVAADAAPRPMASVSGEPCSPGLELDAAQWTFVAPRHGEHGDDPVAALARRLFDLPVQAAALRRPASVVREVAAAAWADWLDRIGRWLKGFALAGPSAVPARAIDRWSGALWLQADWCDGRWTLALPAAAVQAALGAGPILRTAAVVPGPAQFRPIEPLDRALATHPVRLRATLEGAELTIGQLQAIRPGHVIALEHALDQPALVETAEGGPLAAGWLGQHGGRVAIELAPLPPSSLHESE